MKDFPPACGSDLVDHVAHRIAVCLGLSGGITLHVVISEVELPTPVLEQAEKECAQGWSFAVHKGKGIHIDADCHVCRFRNYTI